MSKLDLVNEQKQKVNACKLGKFDLLTKTHGYVLFCYKFQPILEASDIFVRPNLVEFPMFDLFMLESLSILSAYVFYVPSSLVDVFDYYVRLKRPSAKDVLYFRDVKLVMQDKRLNIYHSHDGATLISLNGLQEVIKPSMVRKSEKNEQEEAARAAEAQENS